MLKNYITIAFRNLSRQSLYSFINIVGLATGMACSLVIFLYVYGEWSHDRHFKNGDRIYRIGVSFFNMGPFGNGPERLREFLPGEFEGMEAYTRFQKNGNEIIQVDERRFTEVAYYIDSAFFKVFSYSFAKGDAATAMLKPSSVVLTESLAKKYFKTENAIGKIIEVGKQREPFVVTAVVKDEDHNSHLKAKLWLTLPAKDLVVDYWSSASVYTYVLLKMNSSATALRGALDRVIAKHVYNPESKVSLEDYIKDENSTKFFITPLKDIYLRSKAILEASPGGNETNLYIFSIIAVFILVLAGVNFINLSTARASRRAKEVGIRKSLGTSRSHLVAQFLLESVMISVVAMIVALGLSELFSFAFYWITGQPLSMRLWSSAISLISVLLFTLAIGIIAGIYPAFYLTSFQPAKVLKGNLQLSRSQTFRNGLVVFQFVISITLIICTSIIIRQMNYMSGKDLGFNQENIVTIDNVSALGNSVGAYKNQLVQRSEVTGASFHSGQPGSKAIISVYTYRTPEMQNDLTISTYFGDHNFLNVMGFKLISGRDFNKDLASDTASVILNESAVQALGLLEPLGAIVNTDTKMKVIGVVQDFHWESLRNEIAPLAIVYQPENSKYQYYQLALKAKSSEMTSLLNFAEAQWKQMETGEDFSYHFVDDNFGELLKKEEVLGKAIGFFTVLAILISCLGLFGLAAYTTEQRTKEIGIRKVLGATVSSIVMLLNKQFTRLVLISMAIAIPLSYYAADQWLSGFAYRTDLTIWIFLGGALLGLLVSYATVAFHSIKASQTNPSETLKCE